MRQLQETFAAVGVDSKHRGDTSAQGELEYLSRSIIEDVLKVWYSQVFRVVASYH